MDRLQWLIALHQGMHGIGPDHTMREFVIGLHRHDSVYHFDDDAIDIQRPSVLAPCGWVNLFSEQEAILCNQIVDYCYCPEMFDLAMQLAEDGDEPCVNCGDANPHAICAELQDEEA